MKHGRKKSREYRKGSIAAHNAFDGRGKGLERGLRAMISPSLGKMFPWYLSETKRA